MPTAPWSLCLTGGPSQVMFVGSVGKVYKMDLSGKILGVFGRQGSADQFPRQEKGGADRVRDGFKRVRARIEFLAGPGPGVVDDGDAHPGQRNAVEAVGVVRDEDRGADRHHGQGRGLESHGDARDDREAPVAVDDVGHRPHQRADVSAGRAR